MRMEVLRSEHFYVEAEPDSSGTVTVYLKQEKYRSNQYHYWMRWEGKLEPKGRWWWRDLSVDEAVSRAVEVLHSAEFQLREGETRIAAARATIKALADLEREIKAG